MTKTIAQLETPCVLIDRLRIIPNHACVVSNLVNFVNLVSGDALVETVPVAARGRTD